MQLSHLRFAQLNARARSVLSCCNTYLQRRLLGEHINLRRPAAGTLPVLGIAHAGRLSAQQPPREALKPLVRQLVARGGLRDRRDEDCEILLTLFVRACVSGLVLLDA